MTNYEMIYVVKPNLEEEVRVALADKIKSIIEVNGEITKVDEWGVRKLAYPIEKLNEGHYTLLNFKAATDIPKEIDRNLKISENVIRHLIVNVDAE